MLQKSRVTAYIYCTRSVPRSPQRRALSRHAEAGFRSRGRMPTNRRSDRRSECNRFFTNELMQQSRHGGCGRRPPNLLVGVDESCHRGVHVRGIGFGGGHGDRSGRPRDLALPSGECWGVHHPPSTAALTGQKQ